MACSGREGAGLRVIGLTGGIGSGKSTVSALLAEKGAHVIDADKIGHRALEHSPEVKQGVLSAFGSGVLTEAGAVDRKRLGEIVFNDASALQRLNAIIHPQMYRMMAEEIEQQRALGCEVVVLEAAILLEAGWTSLVDEVWVCVAGERAVVERLRERNNLSEEQVRARVRAQIDNEERVKRADVVIVNDGTLEQLRREVDELWERLHARRPA